MRGCNSRRRLHLAQSKTLMHLSTFLNIAQIASSGLLIAFILLQHRGTGLGGAFGGAGNIYRSKRGVEQVLFRGTIILAIIFVSVSLASVLIHK